jgi:hypothetical protein
VRSPRGAIAGALLYAAAGLLPGAMLLAACGASPGSGAETAVGTAESAGGAEATVPESEAAEPSAAPILGTGHRRALTPNERLVIERLFQDAEHVRELKFLRPVPVEVHDRAAIEAFVRQEIREDDLSTDRLMYVALGLIEADTDIESMLVNVLGEQIVGYYDTKGARFVVRTDIMEELRQSGSSPTESKMVIVHEMIHALQDQHLGLGDKFEKDTDTDAGHAYHAVVEGDATLGMVAYIMRGSGLDAATLTQNPAFLESIMGQTANMPGQDELSNAPPIVRVPLLWGYIRGLNLCARGHGDGGWRKVDAIHERPPLSTEQVAHPEKYLANEAPVALTLPALPELERAGFVPLKDDTLGELELGIFFGLPDTAEDPEAAAGWGGDRIRAYRRAEDTAASGDGAIVWLTAWDTEKDAKEAEVAARRAAGKRGAVARKGLRVAMTLGLPDALSRGVLGALTR